MFNKGATVTIGNTVGSDQAAESSNPFRAAGVRNAALNSRGLVSLSTDLKPKTFAEAVRSAPPPQLLGVLQTREQLINNVTSMPLVTKPYRNMNPFKGADRNGTQREIERSVEADASFKNAQDIQGKDGNSARERQFIRTSRNDLLGNNTHILYAERIRTKGRKSLGNLKADGNAGGNRKERRLIPESKSLDAEERVVKLRVSYPPINGHSVGLKDSDFTPSYPAPMNSRRGYNDFSGGGGGGNPGGGPGGPGGGPHGGGGMGMRNAGMGSAGNMVAMNNSMGGGNQGGGENDNSLPSGNGTNLIVNYLPQDMTDRELYSLFRTFGPISTCRIMRDYKTGYSFGYAFVDMASEADSQRAIKSLNGVNVRNKRLKVSYARPGGESIKDTNLYVTNLPRTITDDQLETIFGKYGSIVQKNILRDKLTGKPRGVAFVRFNKREEAQEAISNLNNIIPQGASQPLTVRLAEEHGKAKAQHFINQMGMGGGGGGGGGPPHGALPPPGMMNPVFQNNMVHRDKVPVFFSKA